MASEKEASAEDGFAGSRVILPSGCDVRRDAEWPMVGMETRLSEHLPRLPAGSFSTHIHMGRCVYIQQALWAFVPKGIGQQSCFPCL